jgi:hypothetical protein
MSFANRTTIIRAGLGVAVKALVAACSFAPAGEVASDGGSDGPAAIDADVTPQPFCDRDNPDLRLCMTFEESAVDEAGAGVVIDVMDNLGFLPGKVGSAVQLMRESEIHAKETPALDMTAALTMEAFVFVAEVPTNRAGIMDNNGQWGMWVGSNMRPYCTLSGSTVSGPTIAVGAWTHVTCVFDSLTYRIYVDGALFGTVNRQVPAPTTGADGVNIGQDCTASGAGDPLTGAMDEVRIWASPRSEAQIAAAATRTQ